MFTNFDNVFKNSKKNEKKVPREILNVLNQEIPKELQYKEIENGICGIFPKNNKPLKFTTKIKLPDIPKQIKKQIHNFDDLYEYLYRTQKKCEILPNEQGNIKVNNVEIKIEDFIKDVINENSMKLFELTPPSFPDPINIKIKAGHVTKIFNIERQPYESMTKVYLKSIEEDPICIKLYISDDQKINFNISINIKNIENISEIVDICEFYKYFLSGEFAIGDSEIKNAQLQSNPKSIFIDKNINFWKKALEVEKVFNKKFNACKFEEDDYLTILRLYKSLVEKKPYKINEKITSITFDDEKAYENCKKITGKQILIEYERKFEGEILGENIEFFVLERIYNCNIKEVLREERVIKVIFDDYTTNNTFIARRCFLNHEQLEEEKLTKNNKHEEYENAEII